MLLHWIRQRWLFQRTIRQPVTSLLGLRSASEGTVALATPLESWPQRSVGAYCLGEITPREHAFALDAGATATVRFEIRARDAEAYSRYDSIWAVAKVACNGLVDYIPVPGTSIRT